MYRSRLSATPPDVPRAWHKCSSLCDIDQRRVGGWGRVIEPLNLNQAALRAGHVFAVGNVGSPASWTFVVVVDMHCHNTARS